ncbi:hypothetical protein FB45DRAFT_887517 [Roridomyces roridus]|uniref:Uncharacterized protein n=1 Tax=Roridomyces roridus TaxID=1738132 RepID=A0AAD7CJ35_9AGAR|nr:hypothetical protein FB45DRAFT_887517 [Roridomyces roridus]
MLSLRESVYFLSVLLSRKGWVQKTGENTCGPFKPDSTTINTETASSSKAGRFMAHLSTLLTRGGNQEEMTRTLAVVAGAFTTQRLNAVVVRQSPTTSPQIAPSSSAESPTASDTSSSSHATLESTPTASSSATESSSHLKYSSIHPGHSCTSLESRLNSAARRVMVLSRNSTSDSAATRGKVEVMRFASHLKDDLFAENFLVNSRRESGWNSEDAKTSFRIWVLINCLDKISSCAKYLGILDELCDILPKWKPLPGEISRSCVRVPIIFEGFLERAGSRAQSSNEVPRLYIFSDQHAHQWLVAFHALCKALIDAIRAAETLTGDTAASKLYISDDMLPQTLLTLKALVPLFGPVASFELLLGSIKKMEADTEPKDGQVEDEEAQPEDLFDPALFGKKLFVNTPPRTARFFGQIATITAWTIAADAAVNSNVLGTTPSLDFRFLELPREEILTEPSWGELVEYWGDLADLLDVYKLPSTKEGSVHSEAGIMAALSDSTPAQDVANDTPGDLHDSAGGEASSDEDGAENNIRTAFEELKKDFSVQVRIAIGVAKKSCPCCRMLAAILNKKGAKFEVPGSHTTIFPWVPPKSLRDSVLQEMEKELLGIALGLLEKTHATASSRSSSPGSEDEPIPARKPKAATKDWIRRRGLP